MDQPTNHSFNVRRKTSNQTPRELPPHLTESFFLPRVDFGKGSIIRLDFGCMLIIISSEKERQEGFKE
jgi:hypothetical protein